MIGSKMRLSGKPGLLFLLCSLILGMAIVLLFALQKERLDREIDGLVGSNLHVHIHNKAAEINAAITDARHTLEATAEIIQATGLSPKEAWFKHFLGQLNPIRAAYSIAYIPMEDMREGEMGDLAERLARDGTVVTDILYSRALAGYYFSVATPVWENGEMTGALSARMGADSLIRVNPDSVIYKDVRACLVTGDGRFAFNHPGQAPAGDIFTELKKEGLSQETLARIADGLSGRGERSSSFIRRGSTYFVSVDGIGYNDWHLVAFVRGPDVLVRSDRILGGVLRTCTALVLLTTGVCCVIYAMLLADRKKLEREQRRYTMLAQFSDTVLFEYNRNTDSVEFTANAQARLCLEGLSIENVSCHKQSLRLFHPDDLDKVREIFHERKKAGILYYTEVRIKCRDGRYFWYGCQYRPLDDVRQDLSLVVGKLVDITNQRSREQKLAEKARRDVLTGTYNKAGADMIDDLLKGRPQGVLMMMDMDRFKKVNDTYGHSAGDAALAQLGRLLNELFRKGDIIARVGGDEFVIFLPGPCDLEMARERMEQLLARIQTLSVGDGEMVLSASAGLAIAPQDGSSFQELYAVADKAMYVVKRKHEPQSDP